MNICYFQQVKFKKVDSGHQDFSTNFANTNKLMTCFHKFCNNPSLLDEIFFVFWATSIFLIEIKTNKNAIKADYFTVKYKTESFKYKVL